MTRTDVLPPGAVSPARIRVLLDGGRADTGQRPQMAPRAAP